MVNRRYVVILLTGCQVKKEKRRCFSFQWEWWEAQRVGDVSKPSSWGHSLHNPSHLDSRPNLPLSRSIISGMSVTHSVLVLHLSNGVILYLQDIELPVVSGPGWNFILLISVIWKYQDIKGQRLVQGFGSPFIPLQGQAKQCPETAHVASGYRA